MLQNFFAHALASWPAEDLRRLLAYMSHKETASAGTWCSGTDSPILMLRAFTAAIASFQQSGTFSVRHAFSAERDPRKQRFLLDLYEDLPLLFDDALQLAQGQAHDVRSHDICFNIALSLLLLLFVVGLVCASYVATAMLQT